MEATPMTPQRVISTAVLFLLLGTVIPAFAQKGQEKKGGGEGKAQQVQRGAGQKAQKERPAQHQQQAQRTRQAQRRQQPHAVANNRGNNGFHGNGNNGNHYGRIPDDRYRANFGRVHAFRMGPPQFIDGYNRFQYSGYWFGYNQPWPSGWDYNDDVYVVYVGGAYYMYNRRHSGIHITLNLF
jgi:hypothetical protein